MTKLFGSVRLIGLYSALLAYFFILGLGGTSAHHLPADALLFALLYAGLALALLAGSAGLAMRGRFLGCVGALGVAGLAVWHAHEQTRLPTGNLGLSISTLIVAVGYFSLVRGAVKRAALPHAGVMFLVGMSCVALISIASTHLPSTFRWHLLRHHKLIGTPLHYLFDKPMRDVEDEMFSGAEPGPQTPRRAAPPPSQRAQVGVLPDVVFVMIDTLRSDSVSHHGGDPWLMPNLNRMADASVVFTDVFANASWTKPSVASFFTGRLPEEHGAIGRLDGLSENESTLAEALRERGYRSAAFVTNYGHIGRHTGFDQGFDDFVELGGEAVPYTRARGVNEAVSTYLSSLQSPVDGDIEHLSRPLFLYVHYLDPHAPYLSGGRNSVIPRLARRSYDTELKYLDGELAGLFELYSAARPRPTITLIVSDHGEEFGEHDGDFLRHGHSLYAEVLRIPVILKTPTSRKTRIATALEARDLYDLLLDLSLEPALDLEAWANSRERRERHASVYMTHDIAIDRPYLNSIVIRGVERGGYFFIWSGYGGTRELYDLRADPRQLMNIVDRYPDVSESLYQAIRNGPRPHHAGNDRDISELDLRQLRALGYIR